MSFAAGTFNFATGGGSGGGRSPSPRLASRIKLSRSLLRETVAVVCVRFLAFGVSADVLVLGLHEVVGPVLLPV